MLSITTHIGKPVEFWSARFPLAFYVFHMKRISHHPSLPSCQGFTLIELVLVVLFLGIIASLAASRLFDTAIDGKEASTKQSQSIIHGANQSLRTMNPVNHDQSGEKHGFRTDPLIGQTTICTSVTETENGLD